jgi:O-antigen/teichoic acid export membrane protein
VAGAAVRALAALVVSGTWRNLRAGDPDRVILAIFLAPAEVGAYVAAAALIGPAVQVAAAMGTGALTHAAARLLSPGRDDGGPAGVAVLFTAAGQAAAGVALLCLPTAVTVLFGSAGEPILWLALALCLFLALRFANFGLSALLLARGGAASRLAVLVLSIAGNTVLNLAFVGRYGAGAAAWATVATEVIVAGALLWFLRDRALVRPTAWCWGGTGTATVVLVAVAHGAGAVAAGTATGFVLLGAAAATVVAQRRSARVRVR